MKTLTYSVILSTIFLSVSAIAQSNIIFERYSTAWAMDSLPISKLPAGLLHPKSEMKLLIPQKDFLVKKPNGNRYIKMYLVNSLPYTVAIKRNDAAVSGVTTEIYVHGHWKLFQTHMAPGCEQGKWEMKLKDRYFLNIELEDTTDGTVDTLYRVRLKTPKYELVSNTITVKLRQDLIEMAGTIPALADNDF